MNRLQQLAGLITESQLNEALNKDIKAFGQDLDKRFKAAGFDTLITMQAATPEQLNIVKTNPKAILFEVYQNQEMQSLYVYVNPSKIKEAENIINKFQLSNYSGPVLKRGWTSKQVQGAINPGDIVKQDSDKDKGIWNFYRLAPSAIKTRVKTLSTPVQQAAEALDIEEIVNEALKAVRKEQTNEIFGLFGGSKKGTTPNVLQVWYELDQGAQYASNVYFPDTAEGKKQIGLWQKDLEQTKSNVLKSPNPYQKFTSIPNMNQDPNITDVSIFSKKVPYKQGMDVYKEYGLKSSGPSSNDDTYSHDEIMQGKVK
jgi:hypothetical protein